ncbi:unnamed protein product [Hymenolepis diminuta]|uniref:Reverse transcriptase RNase H-like domain-containing protein n=1 Tax=Hymenolepis diminuta TaxID=6216 RepID=A0A564YAH4_HYMDI|nr:unnamed protein product [Hymenolepis diminuta]
MVCEVVNFIVTPGSLRVNIVCPQVAHPWTHHKSLQKRNWASSGHYSPREIWHLDYVFQFANDIRHVKGSDNVVAECLSRTNVETITKAVNFHSISKAQKTDFEL